jgi:tetratricopeptide (TPR) repeat protein
LRVRAYVAAGHILTAVQNMEDARLHLAEARTLAGSSAELLASVLVADVELATRQGDFKRALDRLAELEQVVQSASNEREKHRVALLVAQASAGRGDRATALGKLSLAEQLLPDDKMAAVERIKVRALVDFFTRDFRSAILHAEMAIEMGRELGLSYDVMFNLHTLGDVLIHVEDLPRAYGALRQSLELCEEFGYERFANYNRMFLAFLDGLQGAADAEKLLAQGLAYAASKEFTGEVIGGQHLLAKLLHRRGRVVEAEAEYEKTRTLAMRAGQRFVADECDQALHKLAGAASSRPSRSLP